ncbi:hypothetical protein Tco_0066430 [Tanacetum coccineum]
MDNDTAPDEQVHSSGDEDIGHDRIPMVNLKQNWWKPLTKDRPATPKPAWFIPLSDLPIPMNNWASALASTYAPPPENSLLAQTGDMAIFMDWFCKKQGITELKQQDLEGPAYEIVKVFHPNVIHLQYQMEECHKLLTDQVDESIIRYNVSKPLPLGGPPGQVTIQSDFFFNKDLEYLRYGRKSGRPALLISKMKAAYYPDVGLEQMVPDQMWIEEECKYDIAAMYGISHWWFQRQRFYIDRHTSEGERYQNQQGGRSSYTESLLNAACKKYLNLLKKGLLVRGKLRQLPSGEYRDGLQIANMDKMIVPLSVLDLTIPPEPKDLPRDNPLVSVEVLSKILRVLRIILVVLPEHPSDTKVLTMKMEILLELTSNKLLSALRRSDKENMQVWSVLTDPEVNPTSLRRMTKPYSSTCFIANCFITGSRKDGDGDTSFQWSQFTTPCSHLMLLIKDIMTNERPTTQLPQL